MKKLLFVFTIALLTACGKKDNKVILRESTGTINSLLIVMNNNEWKGKAGDALRDIIGNPVLGLPQEENQFSVHQVAPKTFGSLFKANRNILFVGVDKKNEVFNVKTNLYASPQTSMTILAKDEASLIENINAHKKEIIKVFKDADINFFQKKLIRKTIHLDSLKTLKDLGITMKIPEAYRKVDDTGNFLWLRNEDSEVSKNMLVYSYPLPASLDSMDVELPAMRDSIGKKYIPGGPKGSHMITEAAYSPHIKKVMLNDKNTFETRGKWEVKGDFMAGPFLNYAVVDKKKNRLVVIEGFTYAPNAKKRDYMFELEAILKTLKI